LFTFRDKRFDVNGDRPLARRTKARRHKRDDISAKGHNMCAS